MSRIFGNVLAFFSVVAINQIYPLILGSNIKGFIYKMKDLRKNYFILLAISH